MRLGLGHGLDVGYRPELFGNLSLLQQFPGAAAAYSLRNIDGNTATNVVRVRRSSDDAEADFTAAEVSDGTMLSWVNTEVVRYSEDFVSATGWTLGTGMSITGGVLNFSSSPASQFAYESTGLLFTEGQTYRVQFTISNYSGGAIQIFDFGGSAHGTIRSGNGTYTEDIVFNGNANKGFRIDSTFTGDIDNFSITQLTANGFVVTWYDQSGNGKNFTQAMAANQPKLVNAGSLITLNSLPAIESDGTDDFMQTVAGVFGTVTDMYAFTVAAFTNTGLDNDFIFGVSNGGYGGGSHFIAIRQFLGDNQLAITTPLETTTNGASNTNQHLFTGIYDGGAPALTLGIDGSDVTESATVPTSITPNQEIDLFAAENGASKINYGPIKAQELFFYASDKSADRAAIETAINSHYIIY